MINFVLPLVNANVFMLNYLKKKEEDTFKSYSATIAASHSQNKTPLWTMRASHNLYRQWMNNFRAQDTALWNSTVHLPNLSGNFSTNHPIAKIMAHSIVSGCGLMLVAKEVQFNGQQQNKQSQTSKLLTDNIDFFIHNFWHKLFLFQWIARIWRMC